MNDDIGFGVGSKDIINFTILNTPISIYDLFVKDATL